MPGDIIYGKSSNDIENVEWNVGTAQLPNVVRFGSSSSQASQNSGDICRICHCESDPHNPLLTPCYCSGSLKYVHQTCLQQWLTASETNSCELCKFPFIMHTKIKPFNEWRSLDMSGVERRRLFCAVLFHCAAALCVIWSLCVLIERAAEEVKRGLIGWPFWTKLVVVTVGLTGGVVFMYIQCRQYLHLCHRWRARNRILLIQNAPEKIHPLSPPSPVARHHLPRNSSSSTTNGTGGISDNIHHNINRPSHGQIVANIENNPSHFERDWMLDDSSQSSFKPCPQGSGSMTPFHDSVHNMYENPLPQPPRSSSQSTNSSGSGINQLPNPATTNVVSLPGNSKTNDLNLFKVNTHALNFPNSAVFLENSDILNDAQYPKLYHRHSTIFVSPEINENLNKFLAKDTRRYSDTKLLHQQRVTSTSAPNDWSMPIFNVTNVLGLSIPTTTLTTTDEPINNINITDIIFENADHNNFDPLELNIQEMLELDIHQQRDTNINNSNKARLSLNNVSISNIESGCATGNRTIFKSLPNLSASSENLLQK